MHKRLPAHPELRERERETERDTERESLRYVAMGEIYPTLAQCAVVAAAFKILLFPA